MLGYLHHKHYVKHQSRGVISYVHIWIGRLLMVLGIINGGLGMRLSGASSGFITGYSVAAVVILMLYILVKVRRRKRAGPWGRRESPGEGPPTAAGEPGYWRAV